MRDDLRELTRDGTLEAPSVDWLVLFLLLEVREEGRHERDLTRRMAERGFEETRPGTVYRTLRLMEEEGMVRSGHDGNGASRQRFEISESGEIYLELWAGSLRDYQEEIDLFFEFYGAKRAAR